MFDRPCLRMLESALPGLPPKYFLGAKIQQICLKKQKTLKYVEKIQGTDRKICTSGSRGIRPLTIQPIFFQLIFGMLNFVADVESQKFWLKMFSLMIFVSTDLHWQ